MEWFYAENQKQVGPLSEAEFARLVGAGTIRRETLVWRAGMKDWQPYGSLLPPPPPSPPPSAAAPGGPIPGSPIAGAPQPGPSAGPAPGVSAPGAGVSGAAAGVAFSAPAATMSPVRPVATTRYGGFWIRFLARVIDYLILKAVGWIVLMPLGLTTAGIAWSGMHDLSDVLSLLAMSGMMFTISVAIAATYEIALTTMKGGTLGKLALGLRVVRPDGSKVLVGRATARYFATWLSRIILCIGYIIAAFDAEKRSLHDMLCDTRVVRI